MIKRSIKIAICIAPVALWACDNHGHDQSHGNDHAHGEGADHEHPHPHGDDHSHGEGQDHGHKHADEHPAGHNHHADGHGHGGEPTVGITLWSDQFELFGEHPPGVAGKEMEFLLHVTALETFGPIKTGGAVLELNGPSPLRAEASAVIRPGIFLLKATPTKPGTYKGLLRLQGGKLEGDISGVQVVVHGDAASAKASVSGDDDDHGVIEFLKEQQWNVPFGTAFVESGSIVATVEVGGRIDTPPGGKAEVGAPITGTLVAPRAGLLRPGAQVKKGQLLASVAPAPSSPEGAARAKLAVTEAMARQAAAKADLSRAERLFEDEAIAKRDLENARREAQVAAEAVQTAKRGSSLYSGGSAGGANWKLNAPISGTLVTVDATPGATVAPGSTLFRIVDDRELWIVARVPEQDAAQLRKDRDASFRLPGVDAWNTIRITDPRSESSLVSIGRTVDPNSRTVDVIYSVPGPNDTLRVNGLIQVALPVGKEFEGMQVPRTAVIDQRGRSVVYVQVDGEHFAERSVRVGARSGGNVGIREGLRPGERVVTKGANLVRLAEQSKNTGGHGHIH